jgi:hypothetical protein
MVRSVEHIEQNITTLQDALRAIAQDFEALYAQYLRDLSRSTAKQLILAGYHLCTQGYPNGFLRLSFSQRQELQQALRQLADGAEAQFLAYLSAEPDDPQGRESRSLGRSGDIALRAAADFVAGVQPNSEGHSGAAIAEETEAFTLADPALQATDEALTLAALDPGVAGGDAQANAAQPPDLTQPSDSLDLIDPKDLLDADPATLAELSVEAGWAELEAEAELKAEAELEAEAEEPADPLEQLLHWQERIEHGIAEVLQRLSYGANRLLHQADVLPHNLPEPVLEVAARSGVAMEAAIGAPNLMNLVIETKSDDPEESGIIRVIAIRMRLSEVEFANPELAGWRSKLRNLSTRLNQVGQDYHKKQKERAIAQAELAWRSSWYEG